MKSVVLRWLPALGLVCSCVLMGSIAMAPQTAVAKTASAGKAKAAKAAKASVASRGARAQSAKSDALKARAPATRESRRTRAVAEAVATSKRRRVNTVVAVAEPPRATFGQMYGLHAVDDPLELRSSVALVVDQETNEVLLSKNPQAVLPIASITKLMTALVVVEAGQSLNEMLSISEEDVDTEKNTRSRLVVGTQLPRGEMLHLALMSSENRAANALGRHYPGGLPAFVAAMNRKAAMLGMPDTHYVEPTGLSSRNQSSARDLAVLVRAAYQFPLLRELSTSPEHQVSVRNRPQQFHNTNRLIKSPEWQIGLQKTGFISEAGQCLVMQARLMGRKLIMVFLDSTGKYARIGDAERVRKWLTEQPPVYSAAAPILLSPK